MSKNRESLLWQKLKKNLKNFHFTRIESSTINGIPDIHGLYQGNAFWLELKSDYVSYPKLNKWQIVWINNYIKHGGKVIICNEALLERSMKLYSPVSVFTDARSLIPSFSFSFPLHWPTVTEAFRTLVKHDAAE